VVKEVLFKEKLFRWIFFCSAGTCLFSLALICIFILINALGAVIDIGLVEFITGRRWTPTDEPPFYGILPMISGSGCVTLLAIIIGGPLGIFTAVYMVFYSPDWFYKPMKFAVDLLAGIPSIVFGFFGLTVLVPVIRNTFGGNGASMLAAAIILGIMILPTVAALSEASLKAVPPECYENAVALGASKERSVFFAVLPTAKSGVLSAVILGVCRAVGETMAVVMVAGNQARMPTGVLKGVRTLTANIVLEMGYAADLHRGALFATALVLLVLVFAMNAMVSKGF
jgi:phosphate transport system permease protein